MKKNKTLLAIISLVVLSFILVACGASDSEDVDMSKVEYIEEGKLNEVYTSPKDFKNKGVKLIGRVFSVEEDGEDNYLQVFVEVSGTEENTIIQDTVSKEKFKEDDIIYIEGIIKDSFKGENAFGGEVNAPMIQATKIEKKTFMEAYRPALKEKEVNETIEQHGISITVEKIEFAEEETRVYVKATNDSKDKFDLWVYSSKIIQNGKQHEHDSVLEDGYTELQSEISPTVTSEGILVFPKLEESNFELIIEGSSDNYDLEFNPFKFNIEF